MIAAFQDRELDVQLEAADNVVGAGRQAVEALQPLEVLLRNLKDKAKIAFDRAVEGETDAFLEAGRYFRGLEHVRRSIRRIKEANIGVSRAACHGEVIPSRLPVAPVSL